MYLEVNKLTYVQRDILSSNLIFCCTYFEMLLLLLFSFQALRDSDRNDWITALTNAILTGIETRPQTLPRGGTKSMNNSQVMCVCVYVCVWCAHTVFKTSSV